VKKSQSAASRRLIFLCGVIPALLAAVLALYRPAFLQRLDNSVYDSLLRWTGTRPHSNQIVIVNIDEKSLSTVGQWPWRRDVIASLIQRLREMGTAVIAIDILFPEPDRFEGTSKGGHGGGDDDQSPDSRFAETLAGGGVVLGYAFTFEEGEGSSECALHPWSVAFIQSPEDGADEPLFRATGAACSLPMLARAAGKSGFLNAAPDSDGILRRVPLLIQRDGGIYPQLALAAVSDATGARIDGLRVSNVNASSLIIDNHLVPLDGKGNLLVRYRGEKRTFPYVSAVDVMNGDVPAVALRNKIVFVGTTALGTREVVATPLDTLFTGVEVQATVADNLLQRDFIGRHELGTTLESLASLLLGLAVALIIVRIRFIWGAIAALGGLTLLWVGAVTSLAVNGVFMSPMFPSMGIIASVAAMTLGRLTVERRRADTAGHEKATAQQLMVQTLLSLTETRDLETGRHSRRTQQFAKVLAQQLSGHPRFQDYLTADRIELLSSLAPLHDIGKVGVPDAVLNKPGALTPEELTEMRRHPVYGRDVILRAEQKVGVKDDEILSLAKEIVYTHHERWDGTGYPEGLKGTAIPVVGRLMAVVDVYDATVTRTLYRPRMSHDTAVNFIVSGKGTHFDPAVVEAFLVVAPVFERVSREAESG
jgi:adenylate cyclase